MNFTIKLDEFEVQGIKAYLRERDGITRPTKKDIELFLASELPLSSPKCAVNDYIQKARQAPVKVKKPRIKKVEAGGNFFQSWDTVIKGIKL